MNTNVEMFSFFPVQLEHRDLIHKWLHKAHVQPFFYGQGLENTLRKLGLSVQGINRYQDYCFQHWIAYIGDQPLGFLMTSLVEGPYNPNDDYAKWFVDGKKTITLDLLIGEEKYLGRGLAHRMIQEFLIDKFADVATVLIDPAESNTRAIHVYEKAGFKKVEKFIPKFDPTPHWMMRLEKH